METSNQVIIYGAPGTGKSFMIENHLENISDEDIIRVVFHSDYSYSDFIGFITPSTKDDGKELEYNFIAGPFTLALEKSLKYLDETSTDNPKDVYLILEEINRGNSASIFGDIFQLLDRDDVGQSEYPITNISIRSYLDDENVPENVFTKLNLGENEIRLPSNLKIFCTMNTADQNVFVIDTAFKRRFKMKYVPIDFENRTQKLDKLDEISKNNLFENEQTWSEFAQEINKIIDNENYDGFNISEDKKLGQYFVDEQDVSSKESFCDKVIYYLKNDVFKYNDNILKDSYEIIYKEYVKDGKDIFEIIK